MATYMIGYDLVKKEEHDYTNLIAEIEKFSPRWHCLDSTWIIKTNLTAVQVRDRLWAHMHSDDRLLVATISDPAASKGFSKECAEWLDSNL